jgi:Fe-S oxidoreductase
MHIEGVMAADVKDAEPLIIDDELLEELMQVTRGAIGPCFQCGACTAACPWGMVRGEPFFVRTLIRQAQLGLLEESEQLWACTTCAQCQETCPRGVPIAEVMRALRSLLWKRRDVLQGLPNALWSIYWNNNPWSQPPSQRPQWAKDLDLPSFDPEKHTILLYVGCTPSYDRRAQRIARSLVKVLQAAEVSFGYLGEEEPCCGETVLSLGHKAYFDELIAHAANIFHQHGVHRLVTISPHCFDVFHNHLPYQEQAIEVCHHTQLLAELLEQGHLQFHETFDHKLTFQDPCFLGRWNQVYDPPRQVLAAIPRLALIEMEPHRADALCCGGGGGRMLIETASGQRFSDLRVQQAVATGAEILATACPFCIACLEDSIKAQKLTEIVVMDIAEIAALALSENGEPMATEQKPE